MGQWSGFPCGGAQVAEKLLDFSASMDMEVVLASAVFHGVYACDRIPHDLGQRDVFSHVLKDLGTDLVVLHLDE